MCQIQACLGSDTLALTVSHDTHNKREDYLMSKYVVICQADECEAENTDYDDDGATYWFTCSTCGWDNEVVHSPWK